MASLQDLTYEELLAEKARRTQGPKALGGTKSLRDMTDAELEAEKARRAPGSLARKGEAAASGTRKGTEGLAGFPADTSGLVDPVVRGGSAFLTRVARAMGVNLPGLDEKEFEHGYFGERPTIRKAVEQAGTESIRKNVTDPLIGPNTFVAKTPGEKYTESIAEAAPGAVAGPGGRMAKIAQAVATGAGAQAGEDITKGTRFEPYGRLAGGLATSMLAPGTFYANKGKGSGNAGYDEAVRALEGRGVKLTAGQKLNSRGLRYAESELGGGTFDKFLSGQQDQFTQSVMADIGFPGRRATPENLVMARREIGGRMDDLAKTTSVKFDQKLQDDMLGAVTRYQEVAGNIAPGVERVMNRAADLAAKNGGKLEGEAYRNIVSEIRDLTDAASGDAQQAFGALRDALDNGVERSISSGQLDAWQKARRDYRGLMTVERSMGGRDMGAAGFDIDPKKLRGAISGEGPASIAEARNPLTEPANSGVTVMTDKPNSGSAARAAVRALPLAGAAAIGIGGATLAPLAGLTVAPWLAGKALMDPSVQSMLAPDARTRALLAAAMAASGSTARNRGG